MIVLPFINTMSHDTTWAVWEAVKCDLARSRSESQEFKEFVHTGGIYRGETKSFHFELERYKGKPTGKFLHVSIYRLESGRYELNCYYL